MDLLTAAPTRRIAALFVALALSGIPAVAEDPTGAPAAAAELPLARAKTLYLVVDLDRSEISVRLRGRVLDTVPIQEFAVLRSVRLGEEPEPLELPAVWTIAEDLRSRRPLLAPEELTAEGPATATPLPTSAPPPASWSFPTREGWRVEVGPDAGASAPAEGLSRWRLAFRDGWARRGGRVAEMPPRLALRIDGAHAAGLHHLVRPETGLLILGGTEAAPPFAP